MNEMIESHWGNKHIQNLVKHGVQNVEQMHDDSPPDVVSYRKQVSNLFHDGQGVSLTEKLEEVPRAKASWAAHMMANSIKAELCPGKGPLAFAQVREDFIMKRYRRTFEDIDIYLDGCTVLEIFNNLGCTQEFTDTYDEFCDQDHPACKNHGVVLQNIKAMLASVMAVQRPPPLC